jgi:hypothetical protein
VPLQQRLAGEVMRKELSTLGATLALVAAGLVTINA